MIKDADEEYQKSFASYAQHQTPSITEMQALSSEGKTVSIDSANQMKYIANTMKTCTEHIYAKTLKCLDFMKVYSQ
jgi:CRISPR/Cas system CMR-associated protein Cmr5 small subunit